MLSPLRLVTIGLIATTMSCSGSDERGPCGVACPNSQVKARLVSGTVSFSIAGGPVETHTVGPGDPPLDYGTSSPTRCTASAPVERANPEGRLLDSRRFRRARRRRMSGAWRILPR